MALVVIREYRRNSNVYINLMRTGRSGSKWVVNWSGWMGGNYGKGHRKFYTNKQAAFDFYEQKLREDAVMVATRALNLSTQR